ncbi:DUF1573 domain-containing protein [Flavobacterium selenitireducens]|uniref:DUF1573 domain-containing protein n=1 Tax=Flavobacterium selenitireducens TaxID=2722704 RepID=UPI00168BFB66|nr:DUF1573 domain-containing protein [Flavobacterium selenitireducens]MBD3582579.1 DUF1573 domain-containing protein [Flavobacterium selenitireducens]
MKTLKITILAVAFGMMSFTSKPAIGDPVVKTVTSSPVAWKADAVEVGSIPQGTPKSIEFSFKNTGKSDIIITNVKPACGCTAADYTKTPIKPGETAYVKAIYNAAAKGAFSKTVTVTTNADATPKVLTFKGTVI